MNNSLDFPEEKLIQYLNTRDDLNELKDRWEGYDDLTKKIIISFSSDLNTLDFLLAIDTIVRNNKFNNKLKDILDE